MKKITFLLVSVLLLSYSTTQAQFGFRMGIKGGPNFSSLNVSESFKVNYDNRTSYHFGAFMTLKVAKLAIQPEVLYSSQGAMFNTELDSRTFNDLRQEFNYINIPVMLKLYLAGGLNFQVGPQFGYLLDAKSENQIIEQIANAEKLEDAYKDSDLSIALGIGLDLPLGLTLDARYNYSLDAVNATNSIAQTRNQVYQVSIGYRFIDAGN